MTNNPQTTKLEDAVRALLKDFSVVDGPVMGGESKLMLKNNFAGFIMVVGNGSYTEASLNSLGGHFHKLERICNEQT